MLNDKNQFAHNFVLLFQYLFILYFPVFNNLFSILLYFLRIMR